MLVSFGSNGVRFGSEKMPGVDDVVRSRILSVDVARAIPLIGFMIKLFKEAAHVSLLPAGRATLIGGLPDLGE